jgi:hypothetical protein
LSLTNMADQIGQLQSPPGGYHPRGSPLRRRPCYSPGYFLTFRKKIWNFLRGDEILCRVFLFLEFFEFIFFRNVDDNA